MKITLRHKYSYDRVEITPEEQTWEPEMVVDLPIKEVMEMLEVQTRYEELQQKLLPIFKEAGDAVKARREQELAEKERLEQEEKENISV